MDFNTLLSKVPISELPDKPIRGKLAEGIDETKQAFEKLSALNKKLQRWCQLYSYRLLGNVQAIELFLLEISAAVHPIMELHDPPELNLVGDDEYDYCRSSELEELKHDDDEDK